MEVAASTPVPFRSRLQELIGKLMPPGTQASLAERTGLERSTILRLLRGQRKPTLRTLQVLAPALGVTVLELVTGTDAAICVPTAVDVVAREAYEAAVRQIITFEAQATHLGQRLREAEQQGANDREKARRLRDQLDVRESELTKTVIERDHALREAARHERDAIKYREGLERAVTDVASLQETVRELTAAVEAGRTVSRTGAILAGVAAVVSVASYLRNSPEDEGLFSDDEA